MRLFIFGSTASSASARGPRSPASSWGCERPPVADARATAHLRLCDARERLRQQRSRPRPALRAQGKLRALVAPHRRSLRRGRARAGQGISPGDSASPPSSSTAAATSSQATRRRALASVHFWRRCPDDARTRERSRSSPGDSAHRCGSSFPRALARPRRRRSSSLRGTYSTSSGSGDGAAAWAASERCRPCTRSPGPGPVTVQGDLVNWYSRTAPGRWRFTTHRFPSNGRTSTCDPAHRRLARLVGAARPRLWCDNGHPAAPRRQTKLKTPSYRCVT